MGSFDFIYAPFSILVQWPLAGLVPAALFGLGYLLKKGPLTGLAAILWVLYAAYETAMHFRLLCSGECNIRVDLLVIFPMLWIVSIAGIAALFLGRRRRGAP